MPRSTSTATTTLTDLDNNTIYPAQPPVVPPPGPVVNQPNNIPQTNQPTTPFTIPGLSHASNNPRTSKFLINSFDKTNLDTEDSHPNGGIPYSQANDPTSYPSTTMRTTPTRGYFASSGVAASKFYQTWSSKNTYLDFMQKYT